MSDKELIEEARNSFKATNASASMIRRLADALEAATRVPVQGEPNVCLDHKPVQHRDGKPPWCNACGLAPVPDAATEELLKRVEEAEAQSAEDRVEWQQMKERASQRFNAYQQKKRELRQMEIRAEKAEAERAAAIAAIERVRVVAFGHGKGAEDLPVDRDALKAALDWAPEPEVTEWVYRARNSILNSGAHVSEAAARATLQLMIDNYVFEEEPEPVFVERRPRFSWLPVEGESKP